MKNTTAGLIVLGAGGALIFGLGYLIAKGYTLTRVTDEVVQSYNGWTVRLYSHYRDNVVIDYYYYAEMFISGSHVRTPNFGSLPDVLNYIDQLPT